MIFLMSSDSIWNVSFIVYVYVDDLVAYLVHGWLTWYWTYCIYKILCIYHQMFGVRVPYLLILIGR